MPGNQGAGKPRGLIGAVGALPLTAKRIKVAVVKYGGEAKTARGLTRQ
jgi:hypothetical protein